VFCQHVCPVGTSDDVAVIIADHNKAKFPGTVYDETKDSKISGSICSGHGKCTPSGTCDCDENWFGERCHLMCPWDAYRRHCSGNGTCVWNPEVQPTPYCVCKRYNSHAEGYLDECTKENLFIQPNGWCSFYDKELGFDACYGKGLCGVCEDCATHSVLFLAFVVMSIIFLMD